MITLERDRLVFRFPEVHEQAITEIEFQRTLRIPDDTREYPLPPGLGRFPLAHMQDQQSDLPAEWLERGGVVMPLHRAEAMWISFRTGASEYPCAIKIAAGKINAVSGKPWSPELARDERDYVVVPGQPWLDGFCVAKDQVRQFTAMPLGAGYTAEEQITGKAEHGGLQVIVYPMKRERWLAIERQREKERAARLARDEMAEGVMYCLSSVEDVPRAQSRACGMRRAKPKAMGLAAGGRMRQEIYADQYGYDAWEMGVSSRCFVSMLDAAQWPEITGRAAPTRPPSAADYAEAGLPWFDYYGPGETLAGAPALSMLKGVAERAEEKGDDPLDAGGPVDTSNLVTLGPSAAAGPSEARPKGPGN